MPRFGTEMRKRILRTSIDLQDLDHARTIEALNQMREDYERETGQSQSESRAIRNLLALGRDTFFAERTVRDAKQQMGEKSNRLRPAKPVSRQKAAKPARSVKTVQQDPAATETSRIEIAPVLAAPSPGEMKASVAPPPVQVADPTPPASPALNVVEPTFVPHDVPVAAKPVGVDMKRFRNMMQFDSGPPLPEVSAPRPAHKPGDGQSLSPAAQRASTLAKMKIDGREF